MKNAVTGENSALEKDKVLDVLDGSQLPGKNSGFSACLMSLEDWEESE